VDSGTLKQNPSKAYFETRLQHRIGSESSVEATKCDRIMILRNKGCVRDGT